MQEQLPDTFDKGKMPGTTGEEAMTFKEWKKLALAFLKGTHSGRKLSERDKINGGMVGGKFWMWKDVKDMSIQEAQRYLEFLQSGLTWGDLQGDMNQPSSVLTPAEYEAAYGGKPWND